MDAGPARLAGKSPERRRLVTAVSFDRVSLGFGNRPVLADISLTIASAEFIGVLGSNGAGKSTLMRAILGLIGAVKGESRVFDRPVGIGNAAVGYMPQQRNIAAGFGLRGFDFVASAAGGQRFGLPRLNKTERRDFAWALALVEAEALAARPLGELSGGEQQRLLLAQALLGRPKLLLLDEPLINLDPHHQRAVVELVHRLQRDLGIAVLFSAHEINPLLGVLDRVLYLGQGQAALGQVSEVITGPVLSRLYGSPIDVVHLGERIFVMSGEHNVELDAHQHDERHHNA